MAYTAPTAAEIKARFPEFDEVADARIDAVVIEANRNVDTTWLEADYKTAIMYLTAHMLVMEGVLNPDGVAAQAGVTGPIKSESLGDASVTYADRGGASLSGEDAELAMTPYGIRFMNLRRRNVGGPIVVS